MLGALPQLTYLTLSNCDLSNDALQQVSILKQLQHLDVSGELPGE
jgi:Leucine-rich repeat (LRR) protein